MNQVNCESRLRVKVLVAAFFGWCWALSVASAFPAQLAQAPLTNRELLLDAILSARKSIQLNIYEFTSTDIADALIDRVQANVRVEILEEGQPVQGMSAGARAIQAQIVREMKAARNGSRYYEMTSQPPRKRRFRYDHAKYVVIDGTRLVVGSENYSPTGHARPGQKGNRGWEVLLHEPGISEEFAEIFEQDHALTYGDVEELVYGPATPNIQERWDGGFGRGPAFGIGARFSRGIPTVEVASVHKILAPRALNELLAVLRSARQTLEIEQMSFSSEWKNSDGEKEPSPLFTEVILAARRGVQVKVLLNDEHVFGGGDEPRPNDITVRRLLSIAQRERLPLEARIADVRTMGVTYIHNKGFIIDGRHVLVSSINWSQNSVMNNRETAVLLDSPDAASFYGNLFMQDWNNSESRFLR